MKKTNIVAIMISHIMCLLLIALSVGLYNHADWELLLIALSIMFYILSVLSYVSPKFSHHVWYKFGEWVLKHSCEKIESENDSFKKYIKHRYLFLVFAFVFILPTILVIIFD